MSRAQISNLCKTFTCDKFNLHHSMLHLSTLLCLLSKQNCILNTLLHSTLHFPDGKRKHPLRSEHKICFSMTTGYAKFQLLQSCEQPWCPEFVTHISTKLMSFLRIIQLLVLSHAAGFACYSLPNKGGNTMVRAVILMPGDFKILYIKFSGSESSRMRNSCQVLGTW